MDECLLSRENCSSTETLLCQSSHFAQMGHFSLSSSFYRTGRKRQEPFLSTVFILHSIIWAQDPTSFHQRHRHQLFPLNFTRATPLSMSHWNNTRHNSILMQIELHLPNENKLSASHVQRTSTKRTLSTRFSVKHQLSNLFFHEAQLTNWLDHWQIPFAILHFQRNSSNRVTFSWQEKQVNAAFNFFHFRT